MLEKLEKLYAEGYRDALWPALLHCARWKEPLPAWVCEALELANLKNINGDLHSFDKVFGNPNTKAQARKHSRDLDKALRVAKLADEAKASGEGRNEEWFEKVGHAVGEGRTRVKYLLWIARNVWLRRAGQ